MNKELPWSRSWYENSHNSEPILLNYLQSGSWRQMRFSTKNVNERSRNMQEERYEEPLSWFCNLLSSNTTGSGWERRETSSPPNSSMPGMFLGLGLFRRLSLCCSKCLVISASRKMSAVIPQIKGVLWSNIMGSC